MSSMILFDANQLPSPRSPMLSMLKVVADHSGHTLAITDIVMKESVQRRRAQLEDAIGSFVKARKGINKLLPPRSQIRSPLASIGIRENFPNPARREIEEYEKDIRRYFLVLETHPNDALEALCREADRRAPCKTDGRGGRDTAIYLTALRAVESGEINGKESSLPLIFVSNDGAFADPDGNGFHPDLRKEIGERRMVLCRSHSDVMTAIGYPQNKIDPEGITSLTEFQVGLAEAMVDATPGYFEPNHVARIVQGSVQVPRPAREGVRALQCSGGGMTMTTVSGRWVSRVITGDVSEDLKARMPSAFRGFYLAADVTVVVVQKSDGKIAQMSFPSLVIDNSSYRDRVFPVSYH